MTRKQFHIFRAITRGLVLAINAEVNEDEITEVEIVPFAGEHAYVHSFPEAIEFTFRLAIRLAQWEDTPIEEQLSRLMALINKGTH